MANINFRFIQLEEEINLHADKVDVLHWQRLNIFEKSMMLIVGTVMNPESDYFQTFSFFAEIEGQRQLCRLDSINGEELPFVLLDDDVKNPTIYDLNQLVEASNDDGCKIERLYVYSQNMHKSSLSIIEL
jgi:hypothetical protein